MSKIIIHVSEVDLAPNSGMGRIEWYWKLAFQKAGFEFIHIGPNEVGDIIHPCFFPYMAFRYFRKLKIQPQVFIVHEPAAGYFANLGIPCVLESHGVERRYWDYQMKLSRMEQRRQKLSIKTKALFPLWRLRGCDMGLKQSSKLLLSNSEDVEYVEKIYQRDKSDILVFKNGVAPADPNHYGSLHYNQPFTILFNASWVERKGINVLLRSSEVLFAQGYSITYLLIGTGKNEAEVLSDWKPYLRPFVKVVSHFNSDEEQGYLNNCSVFVLPSFFEGQPLSLAQAMAFGVCCISTDCCGQRDLITNRVNGLLFCPGDFQELATLIAQCFNDRMMVSKIGQNAKRHVATMSWDNCAAEVVKFVSSSLSATSGV